MISILIVGKGNVGTHLHKAFANKNGLEVHQISSRNIKNPPHTDVAIIAVSDDAIAEVSIKINSKLVVHTSGSSDINILKNTTNKGVFYMLQTFTKEKIINFSDVPFCLETENSKDHNLLKKIAKILEGKVYSLNSPQRNALHAAAVFVNNFTNYMYKIGDDICKKNGIPFDLLMPLIQETVTKIQKMSPEKAQTGPAIRNDLNTIKNHLNLLDQNQQEIYKLLTKSIQNGD